MADINNPDKTQSHVTYRPSATWQLMRQVGRLFTKGVRKEGR